VIGRAATRFDLFVMFLSPLGERLGEGVNAKVLSFVTPSPSLSPKGGEEHELSNSR